MSVNLGRVAYVEKGAYDGGTTYEKKDVVSYNNGSYVFTGDAPAAGIVPTDSAYWQPMINPEAMNRAAEAANKAAEEAAAAAPNLRKELDGKAPAIPVDASGDMVHFTDSAAMPVQRLVSGIEPLQTGTGEKSPVNPWTISGWDEVSVTNETSGQTLTAALPETVYGGVMDWTTGVLTVNKAEYSLSSVSSWKQLSGKKVFYCSNPAGMLPASGWGDNDKPACSHYVYQPTGTMADGSFKVSDKIYIHDARFETAADFAAWISAESISFVYPLAEPYTIQLTPQQMETLKGENNIWSNAGETEVTYVADTKMYADNKDNKAMIGTVEPGMVASRNYNIGDLFVAQNTMYRTTVAIASGETIVPGSNCTKTTVAENLGGGGGSGGNYVLPPATADTLGGVKVGEGLQMDGDVLVVKPEPPMRLIRRLTVETPAAIVKIDRDDDGHTFSCKNVMVKITASEKISKGTLVTDGTTAWAGITNSAFQGSGYMAIMVFGIRGGMAFLLSDGVFRVKGNSGNESQITPYGTSFGMQQYDSIKSIGFNVLSGEWPVGTVFELYEMEVY